MGSDALLLFDLLRVWVPCSSVRALRVGVPCSSVWDVYVRTPDSCIWTLGVGIACPFALLELQDWGYLTVKCQMCRCYKRQSRRSCRRSRKPGRKKRRIKNRGNMRRKSKKGRIRKRRIWKRSSRKRMSFRKSGTVPFSQFQSKDQRTHRLGKSIQWEFPRKKLVVD